MEEDISNAMEQLLDLTISLQTRINQAYSDLCDYTLSQCVISLMKVNVSLDDFISLGSYLGLIRGRCQDVHSNHHRHRQHVKGCK